MATFISPEEAQRLVNEEQAILIDVREADEFGNARIPGSHLQPLSVLSLLPEDKDKDKPAIYFCRTGRRTANAQHKLDMRGHVGTYILDGGIVAWQQAGLSVDDLGGPLPLMRQVHVAAGVLILLCLLLGHSVAPFFNLLAALVGVGLVYSGLTGKCAMAALLLHMPWNRGR